MADFGQAAFAPANAMPSCRPPSIVAEGSDDGIASGRKEEREPKMPGEVRDCTGRERNHGTPKDRDIDDP